MKRDLRRSLAIPALSLLLGVSGAFAQARPAAQPNPQPARPTEPAQPKPAQIDRNGVLILVRSTLAALHQANVTGNYTVLRDLGAPAFQASNTAARLAEIFATQRSQNLDLSGVLVLDPQLTQLPQILPNGLMHMAGFFPSVPLQVNFELLYAAVQGQWRLMGISVNVGQSGPAAPQAAAPEPAQRPVEQPRAAIAPGATPAAKPKPKPRSRTPRNEPTPAPASAGG